MIWSLPILNVVVSAWLAYRTVRCGRLIAGYWLLAIYFGALLVRDTFLAPIVLGDAFVPDNVPAERIAELSVFVMLCNLSFALGDWIAVSAVPRSGRTLPPLARGVAENHLLFAYLAIFAAGCVVYLPQAYSLSYHEMVNNVMPEWKGLLIFLGLPAITIATSQRRFALAGIGVALCAALVLTSLVRMFLLVSAVPAILILIFNANVRRKPRQRRGALVIPLGVASLSFVFFAGYASHLREGSFGLPEDGLQSGMYLVCDRVDGGMAGTGAATLETVGKSLLYPIYNRFFTVGYDFPVDPATYITAITMVHPPVGSGFQHYPYLWYSDAYLSARWLGAFQGIVWGFLLGLLEREMVGRPVISAVLLPYFTLMLYMFFRGAGAQLIHIVSRALYFHIAFLLLGGLYLRWIWHRDSFRPAFHPVRIQSP